MIAMSSLSIPIVATAVITTTAVSLIAITTVIYVYRRGHRQVLPLEVLQPENRASEFEVEEGKISFASIAQDIPSIVLNEAPSLNSSNEASIEEQPSQVTATEESAHQEPINEQQEPELKLTASQDSACFTTSPLRTCCNANLSSLPAGMSDGMEDEDSIHNDCDPPFKRDWTAIDVSLPEVHMSSRESLLDAVVSVSVA